VVKKRYHEKNAAKVAHGMLSALSYLHEKNVIHRDIKLENILVNSLQGDQILLGDFGLAIECEHEHLSH
jgi:serine/threonine protein kinase